MSLDPKTSLRVACLSEAMDRLDAKTPDGIRAAILSAAEMVAFCEGGQVKESAAGVPTREAGTGAASPVVSPAVDTVTVSEPPPPSLNAGAGPADRVGQRESVNASGAGAPRKGRRTSSDGRHPAASPVAGGKGGRASSLTPSILAQMRSRFEHGDHVDVLARDFGVSKWTVYKWSGEQDWKRIAKPAKVAPSKPPAAPVEKPTAVADPFAGKPATTTPKFRPSAPEPSDADAELTRLWRRGDDFSAICKALRMTQPKISDAVSRLGLANDPTRLKNRAKLNRGDDDAAG